MGHVEDRRGIVKTTLMCEGTMKGHASHSNDGSDRRETNLIPDTVDHP